VMDRIFSGFLYFPLLVSFHRDSPYSSSYSITNLGHSGLSLFQHSHYIVFSSVVVQVVVFLLDGNSEVVQGACCLPIDERVGTNCVCRYKGFLLRMWHEVRLKFLRSFCGQEECTLLFAVNI
jgi:hypothetical protein